MKKLSALVILMITVLSIAKGQVTRTATATAQVSGGFVVGITVTDGGSGYTNVPPIHIIGGGGTNAQGTATIGGGAVTGITLNNIGSGYTTTPFVSVAPPMVPSPQITISPASYLTFTNLQINYGPGNWASGVYFLMKNISGVWSNQQPQNTYIASQGTYSTVVNEVATTNTYALALFPVPTQATATAQVVNGFVTGITMVNDGQGYTVAPTVQITGGGGSGAQAQASIAVRQSGQPPTQVTSITITAPGSGYTGPPSVLIGPPDAMLQFASPPVITPMVDVGINNLLTNLTYQLQSSPDLQTWTDVGTVFMPATPASTNYPNATGESGFFRMKYIP